MKAYNVSISRNPFAYPCSQSLGPTFSICMTLMLRCR